MQTSTILTETGEAVCYQEAQLQRDASSNGSTGPLAYANWRAGVRGVPSRGAYEVPLFTDALIIGEISGDLGPYHLLDTVAMGREYGYGVALPAIVLRVESHEPAGANSLPPITETDVGVTTAGGCGTESRHSYLCAWESESRLEEPKGFSTRTSRDDPATTEATTRRVSRSKRWRSCWVGLRKSSPLSWARRGSS